jgi:hypothetical protein
MCQVHAYCVATRSPKYLYSATLRLLFTITATFGSRQMSDYAVAGLAPFSHKKRALKRARNALGEALAPKVVNGHSVSAHARATSPKRSRYNAVPCGSQDGLMSHCAHLPCVKRAEVQPMATLRAGGLARRDWCAVSEGSRRTFGDKHRPIQKTPTPAFDHCRQSRQVGRRSRERSAVRYGASTRAREGAAI